MHRTLFLSLLFFIITLPTLAQPFHQAGEQYTLQDTLRGSITPERAWWNLLHYDLTVQVFPESKSIEGINVVTYEVLQASPGRLQIDLQDPLLLTKAEQNGKELAIDHVGNAHFIKIEDPAAVGSRQQITLYWKGQPQISRRPPWSGGITWREDRLDRPFIASSNQGDGASVWWPCKDHPYDEPEEGVRMGVRVPQGLTQVGNGRLVDTQAHTDGTTTFVWEVVNPINSYAINLNIGHYVNFTEVYQGEKGALDCSYWVLDYELEKAKEQFTQASMTLEAMEYWLGPYPFYEDSYKLVQAPYLGMEHQSSVTYGNGFQNGYLGRDLSQTGEGLRFDFIIIHESAHEWFANNITNRDVADMWIHESFTNYSESLYLEYHFSKEIAWRYVRGLRQNIMNDSPIIGTYDVNREGSSDMYYKGSNMLHTIRMLVNDDELWREMLRGLNETFYHQTVSSAQVERYLIEQSGIDLAPVFDQYLRDVRIPVFSYRIFPNGTLQYKWSNTQPSFAMDLEIYLDGQPQRLQVTSEWQAMQGVSPTANLTLNPNYYVWEEDQTVR